MSAHQPVRLADYRPPAFLIDTVHLDFDLREDETIVRSRLELRRNPAPNAATGDLRLDGERMELLAISLDGRPSAPSAYELTETSLTIKNTPDTLTLETLGRIKPRENKALNGLYTSSGNWCTQCEAEGFRRITWYLDRPDVMAEFTVRIEADRAAAPVLLSNGNLTASGEAGEGRHWAEWTDPFPKPSYLFALVAGKLVPVRDAFRTASGRNVDLAIWVEPGNEDKCDHAMRSLKKSMEWDERVYGLEYDLDIFNIVAVSDFNMGAMENKSLNVFNSKYVLARPDTASDADFLGIERVIAHEYFHNWTGDRVTCRDWFQLSLKEGLTVFRDQCFSADMNSAAVTRIDEVRGLRAGQFQEDAGATAHPVRPESYLEINNFYTPTVYNKGAEVIRMMRTLLGAEKYRKGIDLYFARHDGQAVTCDDFAVAMADAGGLDLAQFKLWYSQAGTPELTVTTAHDPARATFTLTVRQTVPPTPGQPTKKPMHIPLAVGLLGPDGADLPLRLKGEAVAGETTRVLDVKGAEQVFVFEDVPVRPVPSLLRGFSAPVKLVTDLSEADLTFLGAHDADGFNRWEALQTLGARLILGLVEDVRAGRPPVVPTAFTDALAAALAVADADPAFAAEALVLPLESYLATRMEIADPIAIHEARAFVRKTVAERLWDDLLAAYGAGGVDETFSVDAAAIGRRSLRNVCLGHLAATGRSEAHDLAWRQFETARTMTESVGALSVLADSDAPRRAEALDIFLERWRDDKLVLDKWFAVQATSSRADTLERVEALVDHPRFDIRNPNKVYNLIGAFANGNAYRFHAEDGSGYAFVADKVIEIDDFNPQVAARLMTQFSRLGRYNAHRRAQMRAAVGRVAVKPGLSRDVSDIAQRTLIVPD